MIVYSKGKNQIKKIEGDLFYLSTRKNQSTLLFNDWCFPPPPQQKNCGESVFLIEGGGWINHCLINVLFCGGGQFLLLSELNAFHIRSILTSCSRVSSRAWPSSRRTSACNAVSHIPSLQSQLLQELAWVEWLPQLILQSDYMEPCLIFLHIRSRKGYKFLELRTHLRTWKEDRIYF